MQEECEEKSLWLDDDVFHLLFQKFLAGLLSQSKPQMKVLGGAPGAGKSSYRKKHLEHLLKTYYLHDMDEVLVLLPEYQKILETQGPLKAFEKYWPVAQAIADLMMRYAVEKRFNIIYDRTCGSEGSYLSLWDAYTKGYHISLIGFYMTEANAILRVLKRAELEKRVVTEDITREYLKRFSTLWPEYLKFVNEAMLIDNNNAESKIIFTMQPHKSTVNDYKSYQTFLSQTLNQAKNFFLTLKQSSMMKKLQNFSLRK